MDEVRAHPDFVFAAVKGDYGRDILPLYHYAVLIDVPRKVRLQRVKDRSFQKFGKRMLPGGNLYEREEKVFDLVSSRTEDTVEEWLKSISRPVIRIDGTKPVEENIRVIMQQMQPG